MRRSPTHRRLTVLALIVLVAPALVALLPPASVRGQGGDVVISQVYAGGQSGTAPLRSDYVELFNRGTTRSPSTAGPSSTPPGDGTTWRGTTLTGTIPPGRLLSGARGLTGQAGADLPTPDATGSLAFAAGQWPPRPRRTTAAPLTCGADPGCATAPGRRRLRRLRTRGGQFRRDRPRPPPRASTAPCCAPVDGCSDTDHNATDLPSTCPPPASAPLRPHPCSGWRHPGRSHPAGRRGPHPRHPGQQSPAPRSWGRP